MFFHVFSVPISGLFFNRIFNGQWLQKASPKSIPGATFSAKKAPKVEYPFLQFFSWSLPFFGHRFRASIFPCFLVPFGALLVNVGPFWLHFSAFWCHFGHPTSHVQRAPLHLGRSWLNFVWNRIWNRSPQVGFSQRIWSQHEKIIKPTHHKETNP